VENLQDDYFRVVEGVCEMTIEQEARELRAKWETDNAMRTNWHLPEELEDLENKIAKALQAKQDRIETLESALKEIIDLEHYDSLKDDTQELMVNLAKKALGGGA
jgi:hypothetical protein